MQVGNSALQTASIHPQGAPAPSQAAIAQRPAPLSVWLLDEPECPPYAEFIENSPGTGLFHTLAWRDALSASGAGEPLYLAAMDGERVVGAFPLFFVRDDGATRLVSLPGTPTAGPVTDDDAVRWLLASRATQLAEHRGAAGVFIRDFAGTTDADGTNDDPTWARLSVEGLLNGALPGNAPAPELHFFTTPLQEQHIGRLHALGFGDLHSGLLRLPRGGYEPLCSVARDPAGRVQAGTVWLADNDCIHVLSLAGSASNTQAVACLLRRLAQHRAAGGAQHIDFPLPVGVREALTPWLIQRSVLSSRQEQLHLAALHSV